MAVIAKFKCASVSKTENGADIQLYPVVSGSEENERFYKATPAGQLHLSTVNSEAAAYFEPGFEYLLTFKKTKKA